jgi:hypothetical protein
MKAFASAFVYLFIGTTCLPGLVYGDTMYLDDLPGFLIDAGPLGFESFEGLTETNTLAFDPIEAPDLSITSSSGIGLRDMEIPGADVTATHPATDDAKFIHWDTDLSGDTITFTFASPITEFGVTLKDALDSQIAGSQYYLHLTTNGGASFLNFLVGQRPSGEVHFVGIIADNPFTELVIANGAIDDGLSVDGVYYTPEPSTALLFGLGVVGLGFGRRSLRQTRRGSIANRHNFLRVSGG